MKAETKYTVCLTLLYFAVSFIGILHHELWLDESHHWLLARDSVSFADLLKNTRYEGHPILWNVMLFGITRITLEPVWMQVLHITISTLAVFVFLRKAPFPLGFKVLFIFGYFMLFEYNLISRNYILGILFLFLACSVFRERQQKFIALSGFLALAANVHLMFVVIVFALFLILLLENYQLKRLLGASYVFGYCIIIGGILLAAWQIVPPENTPFFDRVHEIPIAEKFTNGFISLFKGLFPIPDFSSIHFWNSNILVNLSKPFAATIGLLVYAFPLLLFNKNRMTLLYLYAALIGMQLFFFVTQLSATRYDGMAFVIVIIGLWIDHYFDTENSRLRHFMSRYNVVLLRKPLLYSILSIHFLSGVVAYSMDYRNRFTGAKATADYLSERNLSALPIVSTNCEGTSVSPYLKRKIWSLCTGSPESYCRWNVDCRNKMEPQNTISLLRKFAQEHPHVIFLSNDSMPDNGSKLRLLKKFDNNIVRKSNYYIYEIFKDTIN